MFHCSAGGGQSGNAEKLRQIELRLHEVQDVVQAVDLVLQLLDVMQGNPAQMNDSSKGPFSLSDCDCDAMSQTFGFC